MTAYVLDFVQHRPASNESNAANAHDSTPRVNRVEGMRITNPFRDEICRSGTVKSQPQEVFDLCSEDGKGDATGEAHNYGIGNVLDDCAKVEDAQKDKERTCEDRGYGKSGRTVLLNDACDNHDERARGATYLHARTAEERDDKPCYDSGDDALFRRHT